MGEAFSLALQLVTSGNADLYEIVGLSLRVSLSATMFACLIGLPVGAWMAISRFRGRGAVLVLMNALMGLPLFLSIWSSSYHKAMGSLFILKPNNSIRR